MEKITKNNYESYFLDYFEGKLNNFEVAELMFFLSQNIDLDAEFNQYEHFELKKEEIVFNFKKELKKDDSTITGNIFYDKCIDKIENNLTSLESKIFIKEISTNTFKKTEFNLFAKTILKPNLNLVYPNKNELKKQLTKKIQFKKTYQYAAIFIAIIITFGLLQKETKNTNITQNKDKNISIEAFNQLSSFDKYDNNQSFTIIKTEKPSIVSESKNTKQKAEKKPTKAPITLNINTQNNITENNQFTKGLSTIKHTEPNIQEKPKKIIKQSNNSENLADTDNNTNLNCNTNNIKTITNEIKSDVYISQMLSNCKPLNNNKPNNTTQSKSIWELIGEGISTITGSEIEKTYNNKGEISRLALNNNKFRVYKKINK
jgi:hypothetical protein